MTNKDKEYYFVMKPDDNRFPFLVPDLNTEDRRFRFEMQPMGSPPLIFNNGWEKENRKSGIVEIVPDVLFAGSDLVVRSAIRDRLFELDIPSLYMHPTVYIDNKGIWHEDFWYLTFTERFDCWGRATSEYDQDEPPIRLGGYELHQVFSYSLDGKLLDKASLNKRLLFKMGGDLTAFVVCHSSIAFLFRGGSGSGAEVVNIADY
jgi:hypothetical protein